jgi:hypothetical protein
MKITRTSVSIASIALAGALLFGSGCNKTNEQASSGKPQPAPTAQPAPQPVPPPSNPLQPAPATPQQAQPLAAMPPVRQPAPEVAAPAQPPAPSPPLVIPTGTLLRVRLDEDLGSKISQPGQSFTATVADGIVANGRTVIPRGARAHGTVVDAKPLGRFKGGALLELRLDRVQTNEGRYPVSTSTVTRTEQGKGKRTAGFAGGGGALGAIIGGLAGGGKGALIGGLAGAGAGTAGTALTGNKQIVLPAETLVTFRLEHSVRVSQG